VELVRLSNSAGFYRRNTNQFAETARILTVNVLVSILSAIEKIAVANRLAALSTSAIVLLSFALAEPLP
jgi:hypothetical protein